MPKIEIRPAAIEDIPKLIEIDHNYSTDHVWQLDLVSEDRYIGVNFRENRLPRAIKVEYPKFPRTLLKDWIHRDLLLVGFVEGQPSAYISVVRDIAPASGWITDLTVRSTHRRQNIATALVFAAYDWAASNGVQRLVADMQSKNIPAIYFFRKLGFEYCGYQDHYYLNKDVALFFSKNVQ